MVELGVFLFLIFLGLVVGRARERSHFRSLEGREQRLQHMLVTDIKTFPGGADPGKGGALVMGQAVIATAGFTLISEALYLGKPYLAMPMSGQFEQELNAFQLAQCGFGAAMPELQAGSIGDFLYRQPDYRRALEHYDRDPSQAIKAKLLELVADGGKLAANYKCRRNVE